MSKDTPSRMIEQKPSICRIVQYRDDPYPPDEPDAETWIPALIVHVWDDEIVNLAVWDQHGNQTARTSVEKGDEMYQWRWPPKV